MSTSYTDASVSGHKQHAALQICIVSATSFLPTKGPLSNQCGTHLASVLDIEGKKA